MHKAKYFLVCFYSAICLTCNIAFHLFLFFLILGPPMPKGLVAHSMLEIQGDLFVFGGWSGNEQSAVYKQSCSSAVCSWTTINQELKVARYYLVAMSVPDYFCT